MNCGIIPSIAYDWNHSNELWNHPLQKRLNNKTNIQSPIKSNQTIPNIMDPANMATQLFAAVTMGDSQETKELLSQGVSPNIYNHETVMPLHISIKMSYHNITKLLIEYKANIDGLCRNPFTLLEFYPHDMWTPLQYAIYYGKYTSVKLLLQAGANITLANFGHITALEYAKSRGFNRIAKLIESYDIPTKGVHN